MLKRVSYLLCLICCLFVNELSARTFSLPPTNESLIGRMQYTSVVPGDTTPSLAQKFNLGQNALIAANPGIQENTRLRPQPVLAIPTEFMLPPMEHSGVIINLPEMRMYYFPAGKNTVMTFPIGIGKIGKTIPIQNTYIIRKAVNPTWTPPEDIRAFNREKGIQLPPSVGPGPDNPLGPYGIYLKIPTFLIHSTIYPEAIGSRVSFGCIRMNENDIREFFPAVPLGTQVTIIDLPIKVAWQQDRLYMESHPPLQERSTLSNAGVEGAVKSIQTLLPHDQLVLVNWQLVAYLAEKPDGIPHEVGVRFNTEESRSGVR